MMNTLDQTPTLEIRSCRTCDSKLTATFRYCSYCGASQMAGPTSDLSIDGMPVSETDADRDTGASVKKITVVMADDHLVVGQELRAFLATQPLVESVGEALPGEEAVMPGQGYAPDVELIDPVPGIKGDEATRKTRQTSPQTQIIILTSSPVVAISRSDNGEHITLQRAARER